MAKQQPQDRRLGGVEAAIAASFTVTIVASVGLAVLYWRGGQVQWEGVGIFLALGGLAMGLGLWAHHGMPGRNDTEARHPLASTSEERRRFVSGFEEGERVLVRRSLLLKLLGGGLLTLGAAALFPIRSLGPRPGNSLDHTAWRKGRRLVTDDNQPVKAADLATGSLLTVFPEGNHSPGDSQTVVVKVGDRLKPRPGRGDWSPEGIVAYSKICTHTGCPVGLYEATTNRLVCPCHQSLFDAADGARPVFGPATRSLPQLPLTVDAEGYLVARSDYTEPVGPAFWNRR